MPNMPGMSTLPMRQPLPGLSVWQLKSRWTTQDGQTMSLEALRGQPVVAAMVFTHCTDICPLITEKMQDVEAALPGRLKGSVRFVLFSLDWVRDTPARLALFAGQHHLDLKRWTLLHGDEAAVRELAAALGVSFYREPNGDYQHAIAITLLDGDGVVTMQQTDLQQPLKDMVARIIRLARPPAKP